MFKQSQAFSGYSVNNLEEAKKFYGDVLGLKTSVTQEGLKLELEGCKVFLYEKPNHVPATFTVLNFGVEDIDRAADELKEKGIELERYEGMPQDERNILRGRSVGRGPDIAWFKDPAGNILSILQE
jgi:catechol 2,3-dioxygenase-like lactoylglutathione lyase family enzyme